MILCPSSPTGYSQYDRHSISFFCPKQGQGVKPAASPLHPNIGQNKNKQIHFISVHNYSQTVVSLMALRPGRIGICKCWFLWREETGVPGEKSSEQGREPTTNSTHI